VIVTIECLAYGTVAEFFDQTGSIPTIFKCQFSAC